MIIQNIFSFIPIGLNLILLIVFSIIDYKKSNLSHMLENHCIPYSKKRMNMTIKILEKYNIDIHNLHSLDLFIDEAKLAQIQCDYLAPLKKPLNTLSAIILPIVVFVAKKISESSTPSHIFNMAALSITLIILIFSLIFSFIPLIKDLFYRDYNKYNELIYDLRQIKLFYSQKNLSKNIT